VSEFREEVNDIKSYDYYGASNVKEPIAVLQESIPDHRKRKQVMGHHTPPRQRCSKKEYHIGRGEGGQ
jgi:hypothetical protein